MAEGSEHLPEPEREFDDFAFKVANPATGEVMRIYHDGQIEGFPLGFTVVDNRIPELVGRAADLGYQEATLRISEARQRLFLDMIGPFREGKGG